MTCTAGYRNLCHLIDHALLIQSNMDAWQGHIAAVKVAGYKWPTVAGDWIPKQVPVISSLSNCQTDRWAHPIDNANLIPGFLIG